MFYVLRSVEDQLSDDDAVAEAVVNFNLGSLLNVSTVNQSSREDVLTQMKHVITNMTYTKSESDYVSHRGEFERLCGHGGQTEMWGYFVSKGDPCNDMWEVAVDPESVCAYFFAVNGDTITVRSRANEFMLVKEDLKCDCEFAVTMQLPCRHAMACKKFLGGGFIIPFSSIPPSLRHGRGKTHASASSSPTRDDDGENDEGDDSGASGATSIREVMYLKSL
ncbi:Zinc finger, SWIM-type [Phytophthora cactorum]|nr:Zinc finger, SWIM-type [Phytophthora cactorum]